MDPISVITPPLIGGIIGYLTNDLAIKMLFRPYKAMYLGRFRLPFTPGIVPRRLEDLAVLLGREVEARFFNADDLEILFQSQEFSATVAESITDMIFSRRYSLCYVMEGLERSEEMGPALDCAKRALCEKTLEALKEFDYAPLIERAVIEADLARCVDVDLAQTDARMRFVHDLPVFEQFHIDFDEIGAFGRPKKISEVEALVCKRDAKFSARSCQERALPCDGLSAEGEGKF